MPSVTVTDLAVEQDGKVRIRFGKRTREFNSIEHMRMCVSEALNLETLEALAMRLILQRQPAIGNPSAVIGRTLEVDFSKANWGTLG